jgi:hypothetical protein
MLGKLVLLLLGFAAGVPIETRKAQHKALIAALRDQKEKGQRPQTPMRKYSLAEIEATQRAPGATIEFVDDLTAAIKTSPVFRLSRAGRNIGFDRIDTSAGGGSPAGVNVSSLDPRQLQIDGNVQRCGFSWDDAAAKCGPPCPMALQSECDVNAPKVGVNSSWANHNYSCYADLPPCDPAKPKGDCYSRVAGLMDDYCTQVCNAPQGFCNPIQCICDEMDYSPEDPIEPYPEMIPINKMPKRSSDMLRAVKIAEATKMGLPDCRWRPGNGPGPLNCSFEKPYECLDNAHCSSLSWWENNACQSSCLHVNLLKPAPYYALWRPGPLSPPLMEGEQLPHYQHDDMSGQLKFTREKSAGSILMSPFCKKKFNQFVGVTMYSPKYDSKARRLLNSCERVGVCCKATLLPPDVYGPQALEGTEEFRFRTIALKPAFILSQLKSTQLPVVFLDVDMEFHKFPELFMPGSWPDGDRDVAIFNFWGNETNITNRRTPNTGSGVAFFNQTYKAKKVLIAWAEAMAYPHNKQAPDDQVLDKLLVEGGWLKRGSFGWLPAAYLRTVPAYYRGVEAVIDHDHGNPPGLLKHSEAKALLPPVALWENITSIDAAAVKCKAITDLYTDLWCVQNCQMENCPLNSCVCDWQGTWPDDDVDGFANWDLTSLGIGPGA